MYRPAGFSDISSEDEIERFLSEPENEGYENASELEYTEDTLETKLSKLTLSIINGDLESVTNYIYEEGIDVNSQLRDRWIPVTIAASVGDSDILEYLINNGADINAKRDMMTILMLVCNCPSLTSTEERILRAVQFLISKNVDVNAINRKRMTAIMHAASEGYLSVVKLLLPLCDKEAKDNQGWTVLFWAINDCRTEIVKFLLESGLDPNIRDIRANKPLYYAKLTGNDDIINMLPIDEEKEEFENILEQEVYDFNDISANEMPNFQYDMNKMLHGMKCQNLVQKFEITNMNLKEFLAADESNLINWGVELPYQRQRILNGLYKFHKHPWRRKSIPPVDKNNPFATSDMLDALGTAIRQVMVLESSIVYLDKNIEQDVLKGSEAFQISVKELYKQINRFEDNIDNLEDFVEKIDENYNEADLITENSIIHIHRPSKWRKLFYVSTAASLTYIIYRNKSAVIKLIGPAFNKISMNLNW